jgi:hypothetical protein
MSSHSSHEPARKNADGFTECLQPKEKKNFLSVGRSHSRIVELEVKRIENAVFYVCKLISILIYKMIECARI